MIGSPESRRPIRRRSRSFGAKRCGPARLNGPYWRWIWRREQELERLFDRLLAENGPALSRLAASYTNTAADRDDLLQEIALSIWRGLPQFRGECSERTFLFRIAHNRAVTHLTRRRPQATAEVVDVADTAPNPEAGLAREQQGERLRSAVQALPLLYRQVVTLMLEGLDYGEIAQVLGLSESNVGARLSRARQMLREAMEVKR